MAASHKYDVHVRVAKNQQPQLGTISIGRLCMTVAVQTGSMVV